MIACFPGIGRDQQVFNNSAFGLPCVQMAQCIKFISACAGRWLHGKVQQYQSQLTAARSPFSASADKDYVRPPAEMVETTEHLQVKTEMR